MPVRTEQPYPSPGQGEHKPGSWGNIRKVLPLNMDEWVWSPSSPPENHRKHWPKYEIHDRIHQIANKPVKKLRPRWRRRMPRIKVSLAFGATFPKVHQLIPEETSEMQRRWAAFAHMPGHRSQTTGLHGQSAKVTLENPAGLSWVPGDLHTKNKGRQKTHWP